MAAGSDLLDDVFFNTEVDEKVVSDLVGSLECELTGSGPGSPAVQVQVGGSARSDVQGSRTGLSQELAKAGTAGAQGGVINSTRSHGGSTVDAAAGTSTVTTAGSVTVADGQSKSEGTPPSHPGAGMTGKSGTAAAAAAALQTLNGSSVVMNSTHNPSGTTSPPAVTGVNNGPGPGAKARVIPPPSSPSGSTVIQTPNPVTSTVISSQPPSATLNSSVPTVTLVRPPMPTMQSPGGSTAHGGTSTVVTSALHPPASAAGLVANNKFESPKTIIQTSTVAAAVKSPTILQNMSRTNIPTTVAAANPGGIRAIAPQVLAPRLPTQPQQNTPNIQNIQLPPGMVLVRSESGQLLMIHQQTLAQMQAQSQSQSAMAPRPATPTSTPSVQITSVQNTIMLGGTPATSGQPLAPPSPVQAGSAAASQRAGTPAGPTQVTSETLENVKKCKNFLSTLIKLASSGKQSSETTANVKELVKNLLEGKIEAEDFTSRLYKELNSSPQPYLVPFLKRSLPALRQMTPDSSAFIHQSQLPLSLAPPPPGHAHAPGHAPATALTAVVQRPPLSSLSSLSSSSSSSSSCSGSGSAGVKQSQVIAMTPIPHASKPGLQGQGVMGMVRPPGALAQAPVAALRGGQQQHGRVVMGTQGVKQLQAGPVKQVVVPGGRAQAGQTLLTAAQRNKLREAGGTFRDDDDINDVASMAGVNLSEESARILATNSELVGAVTRSCKDEAFLFTSSLTRRVLEIGKRFGVAELGPEVINYISHAAQQRLQNLLEKVSQAAQQRNFTFKEDERYEQGSDVRAQLKFFEQLDQMEKQRKEEQEREILMKAAKSRSRQEDPEQLRLKQKAKEMQQQELAQIRQREANMTALAAIGPRKKRKMDSPSSGAAAEGSGSALSQSGGASSGGGGGGARQFARQRITRVNLRDLLFCLENERESSHSQLLYRGFLK